MSRKIPRLQSSWITDERDLANLGFEANKIDEMKKNVEEARIARQKKEKEEKEAIRKAEAEAAKKRADEAEEERKRTIKTMNDTRTTAISIPSKDTVIRNAADSKTQQLIKRAPDSVLEAKLNNPALFAPDRIRFKNAFGSMIKLPKDDFITGKFIAAVLSGALKLMIFDMNTKKLFMDSSDGAETYNGYVIGEAESVIYCEYTIPPGFSVQWIHQLLSNTPSLMGYLLSRNSICYDFSYYMWIAMTIEPNIYTHMEFISRIFEKYASFSTATLSEKREDAIKANLWEIYEKAQGSSSIQKKIKKMGDLKGAGSILSGGALKMNEPDVDGDLQIKTNYRKINKLLIAPFIYSRLKSSTKSLLIQILTAISFHRELPERYGKVVDGEKFSLFELVKKSALTEKLYDASFDIISCMPIETKLLFLVDVMFKRLL